MFLSRLALPLVFLLVAGAAVARELPPTVAQALARARVPAEAVSLVVEEAGTGTALLRHRGDKAVNPASVMKLVTTLAALETLGPTWSWKTPVYVEGTVRDGVLQGNLHIQGQGDPKLVAERLWLLLRRVQGLGIRQITGDIVLDRSAFEVVASDPAEFDGEPLRPYNAAPDALLLNFKSVLMTLCQTARPALRACTWSRPWPV
jgi:D-alanyl-D-alanine carboxypeptidase/D-alanyl-D-alanine-endopeptidase (penicillin-binding protein 4)